MNRERQCQCAQGTKRCQQWKDLSQSLLQLVQHPHFSRLCWEEQSRRWNAFATATRAYLEHIHFVFPLGYANIPSDYQSQQYCQQCQEETTWIMWLEQTGTTVLGCGPCKEKDDVRRIAVWKLELFGATALILQQVLQEGYHTAANVAEMKRLHEDFYGITLHDPDYMGLCMALDILRIKASKKGYSAKTV